MEQSDACQSPTACAVKKLEVCWHHLCSYKSCNSTGSTASRESMPQHEHCEAEGCEAVRHCEAVRQSETVRHRETVRQRAVWHCETFRQRAVKQRALRQSALSNGLKGELRREVTMRRELEEGHKQKDQQVRDREDTLKQKEDTVKQATALLRTAP